MQGMVWIEPDNNGSMLHVVGPAQYVLYGETQCGCVVWLDPVCVEGVFARADWDKARLF